MQVLTNTRVDQFRGIYTSTPPRYFLRKSPLTFPRLIESLKPPNETWSARSVLSTEFYSIVSDIDELTNLIESRRDSIVSPPMIGHFNHQRAYIEYFLATRIAIATSDSALACEECCLLAASLYHHSILRPFCIFSGVHSTILSKLKRALLTTDIMTCWGEDIKLLFWVLVTAASVEDELRGWFVAQVKRCLRAFVPRPEVESMKWILRKFLWCERVSGPAAERLYREVESEMPVSDAEISVMPKG